MYLIVIDFNDTNNFIMFDILHFVFKFHSLIRFEKKILTNPSRLENRTRINQFNRNTYKSIKTNIDNKTKKKR